MLRNALICIIAAVTGPGAAGAQVSSPLWGPLIPGAHQAGFQAIGLLDGTRSFVSGPDAAPEERPIRLLVWYPASPGTGQPMTLAGYVDPALSGSRLPDPYAAYMRARDLDVGRRQFSPPSDSLFAKLERLPVEGRASAERAAGRFPLVLHSVGRNNFQQESVPLWEYLASHGYVVVVVPQYGFSTDAASLAFVPADQLLQAGDLAAALAWALEQPWIDARSIAVVGHSSGGVAGLLVAASNQRVSLIVGLDASFGTVDGRELLRIAPWSPDRVTADIVDIHAAAQPDRDDRILRWIKGQVCTVAIGTARPPSIATHFDFQAWPVFTSTLGVADPRSGGARPAELGARFYWGAAWLTRAALDRKLKGSGERPLPRPPFLDEQLVQFGSGCV